MSITPVGGTSGVVASGATGKVGVRTLATADGRAFMEVGYDTARQALYVDHSRCCASANTVVQRAPLRATDMPGGGELLELVVIVDGGMLETFASQRVAITSLVSPDERAPGGLEQRAGENQLVWRPGSTAGTARCRCRCAQCAGLCAVPPWHGAWACRQAG